MLLYIIIERVLPIVVWLIDLCVHVCVLCLGGGRFILGVKHTSEECGSGRCLLLLPTHEAKIYQVVKY